MDIFSNDVFKENEIEMKSLLSLWLVKPVPRVLTIMIVMCFVGIVSAPAQVIIKKDPNAKSDTKSSGTFVVVDPGVTAVNMPINQPVVVRPVGNRLPAVPANQFGPDTKFTLGLYDQNGNIDGSRVLTGKELWDGLNQFDATINAQYANVDPKLSALKVTKKIEFDNNVKENVEVTVIPIDVNVADNLLMQNLAFEPVTKGSKVLPPINVEVGPIKIDPGHPTSHQLSAVYNQSWGNMNYFSAFLNANVTNTGTALSRKTDGLFNAGGFVFNKQLKLIEAKTQVQRGTGDSYSYFAVLGVKLWEDRTHQPKKNLIITREGSQRTRFWVGPLPVSVGGAIGGSMNLDVNVTSPNDQSIQGYASPGINAHAAADASIDVWLARAGVEGALLVIDDKLPSTLKLAYNPSNRQFTNGLHVQNNLEALKGKISIYAEVRKFWGGWKKWVKDLISWSGFKSSWWLINQETSVQF